jgi:aspartyl-tRNA(Asn)/glutamyl-tRNA(Gln) amidotransferase subunit C
LLASRLDRFSPAMAISEHQVRQVAQLARLDLSDSEVSELAREMGAILEYMDQLAELDTSAVAPFVAEVVTTPLLASDVPVASLNREQALSAAPRQVQGCFAVPAFVGE